MSKDEQRIPYRGKNKIHKNILQKMFLSQIEFQKRFYNFKNMTRLEKDQYLILMILSIKVESTEALNWLNWKPWKKKKIEFNRYEFLNELVDIQHFLINAAIGVDCDYEEFADLFLNKNKENINRQENDY